VSLLDSCLALLNPEFEQARQPRDHQKAYSRNRPASYATTMGVVDDRHNDAQGRSDRGYHVANPIDQVEERSLGLGRRLALDGFVCGRRAAKILGLD